MLGLLTPFLSGIAPIVGAGISGIAGLLGGAQNAAAARRTAIINAQNQQNINDQNLAAAAALNARTDAQWKASYRQAQAQYQEQTAIQGTQYERNFAEAQRQFNEQVAQGNIDRALQKEFAQQGIQWRAADARAAGLHPLAAMGAQLASAAPISVGGTSLPGSGGVTTSAPGPSNFQFSPAVATQMLADTSRGNALANMGQDISRAISATAHEFQRQQEVNSAASLLKVENMNLENQLLAAQIARVRGAGVGPAMPSMAGGRHRVVDGQGNAPLARIQPQAHQPVYSHPRDVSIEPGPVTDVGYSQTGPDTYAPVMSKDVKERLEEDFIGGITWNVRNRLMPSLGFNMKPPPELRGGAYNYNMWKQHYEPGRGWRPDSAGNVEWNWGY